MTPTPIIARHAIKRYQDRVDRSASKREAALAISHILDKATARPRPRHWSAMISQAPGSRYLYSADYPGICLVVSGGAVVTVHSRPVCAAWRHLRAQLVEGRTRRPRQTVELPAIWEVDAA
jgi:hypothetical protein